MLAFWRQKAPRRANAVMVLLARRANAVTVLLARRANAVTVLLALPPRLQLQGLPPALPDPYV